jgi:hypothetical protein
VLALVLTVRFLFTEEEINPKEPFEFYFDLNTRKVERLDSGRFPPQEMPSGKLKADVGPLKAGEPAGVRAYVYACDAKDCEDEQKRFVAYLELLTMEGKALADKGGSPPEAFYDKRFFAGPEAPDRWVPENAPESLEIRNRAATRCPNGLQPCWPRK